MDMRKLIIVNILLIALIGGCSASKVTKLDSPDTSDGTSRAKKSKAEELFINGSILDLKSKYAEAILEYQEALATDSSAGIHYALSSDYLKLDKIPQALQHAKAAVRKSPKTADYKFLLAQIYGKSNMDDSAASVYEDIIDKDSSNHQAYYRLGSIYEKDKPMEALEIFTKLLEQTGPQWEILVKIARLNERLENVDATVATLEQLVQMNPSNLNVQKLLIETYVKTGKYDKALEALKNNLAVFPDNPELIEYKASALMYKGKIEESTNEYLKIIKNNNVDFNTKSHIGSMYFQKASQDSQFISHAEKVLKEIEKDSTEWRIYTHLGELQLMQNDDSSAIEYFGKAANMASWNSRLWVRYGGLLFDNGRYEKASEELSKVVKNFPDNFPIHLIMGLSLSQNNRYEEANNYLETAVNLNSSDINALQAYGFNLNQLDKSDEALKYLKDALAIDSSNVQVLSLLGSIYDSKENYERSDYFFKKALSLDSARALVLNNYAYSLAERDFNLNKALEMAQEAVEQEPENSSYLDTIGWVYYKLGSYEEALNYINKSYEKDQKSFEVIDHLGDVHLKLGNKEKALEYWSKALELKPENKEIKNKIEEVKK